MNNLIEKWEKETQLEWEENYPQFKGLRYDICENGDVFAYPYHLKEAVISLKEFKEH